MGTLVCFMSSGSTLTSSPFGNQSLNIGTSSCTLNLPRFHQILMHKRMRTNRPNSVIGMTLTTNSIASVFVGKVLRIFSSAFSGSSVFPASALDFFLLILAAAIERPLFKFIYRAYLRATELSMEHHLSKALQPDEEGEVYTPPKFEDSVFHALSGSAEFILYAFSAAGLLKLVVSVLRELNITDLEPAVVGRKALVIIAYILIARNIQRIQRAFMRRATSGKGYFGRRKQRIVTLNRIADGVLATGASLAAIEAVGFKIRTVLTFGGIGSLAVGLAAREAAENLVGGFVILLDRAFVVGELIETGDSQIKGVIEDQGWTHTTIRRLDSTLLSVPNVGLSRKVIHNLSRRIGRQLLTEFNLRVESSEMLEPALQEIRAMLKLDPRIDLNRRMRVYLKKVEYTRMTVCVDLFIIDPDYEKFLELREQIILDITKIFRSNGVKFADPLPFEIPGYQ